MKNLRRLVKLEEKIRDRIIKLKVKLRAKYLKEIKDADDCIIELDKM